MSHIIMEGRYVKDDGNYDKLNEDDEELGEYGDLSFVTYNDPAGEFGLFLGPYEKRILTPGIKSNISLDPQRFGENSQIQKNETPGPSQENGKFPHQQGSELSAHQDQALGNQEAVDPQLNQNQEGICTSTQEGKPLIQMVEYDLPSGNTLLVAYPNMPDAGGNAENRDNASSFQAPGKRKAVGNCKDGKWPGKPRNEDILLRFIRKYKDHPELWDANSPDYRNKAKKNMAYDELLIILKEMKVDAVREDVKRKINSIRTNHNKMLKKIKDSQHAGAGTDEGYTPTLSTFEELRFLGGHRTLSPNVSNVDVCETVPFASEEVEIILEDTQDQTFDVAPTSPSAQSTSSLVDSRTSIPVPDPSPVPLPCSSNPIKQVTKAHAGAKVAKKRKINDESNCQEFAAARKRFATLRKEEDGFKAFATSVGCDLKKMDSSNHEQALIAKKLIGEVLLLGSTNRLTLDSGIMTVIVSGMIM